MKKYEQFINDSEVLVKIGDFILTRNDLMKYKDKITKHYGEFTEETIENSLWTLYTISRYYDKGGILYRAVWLKDIGDLNKDELGYHWVEDMNDVNNIIEIFNLYGDNKKLGDPYIIKAETPPNNVKIPHDYFNNLEENEILVIDPKLLKLIEIKKY